MKSNLASLPPVAETQAIRQTQVDCQLNELGVCVDRMDKLTAALTERLQSVIDPRPVDRDDTAKSAPEPCICPLAERLRNLTKNVSGLADRVQSLTESIEL